MGDCSRVRDMDMNHAIMYTFEYVEDLDKILLLLNALFNLILVSRLQHDAIQRTLQESAL